MVVQLVGELCVHRASELHRELSEHVCSSVHERQSLELDLSQITEIDSAGVQLLLHAKQELARQGSQLSMLGHADVVQQTFDLLGLTRHFGDPMVVACPT